LTGSDLRSSGEFDGRRRGDDAEHNTSHRGHSFRINNSLLSTTPPSGVIRLRWQTFCEIDRFKLVESKYKVIYVESALAKRPVYQFKHGVSSNLLNNSSLMR